MLEKELDQRFVEEGKSISDLSKGPMITNSEYYSLAFNSAIFDGAFRIYFAQFQEEEALKLYFSLQQELKEYFVQYKETLKKQGRNLYILLYPNSEEFFQSFSLKADSDQMIAKGFLPLIDSDIEKGNTKSNNRGEIVFGIRCGISSEECNLLFDQIQEEVSSFAN